MVICQQNYINYTTKHRLLNKAATHLTPADLEKSKLGDPLMPSTLYKVATIINCQNRTHIHGFTAYCPLALRFHRPHPNNRPSPNTTYHPTPAPFHRGRVPRTTPHRQHNGTRCVQKETHCRRHMRNQKRNPRLAYQRDPAYHQTPNKKGQNAPPHTTHHEAPRHQMHTPP